LSLITPPHPPSSTLFPYPPLFRSVIACEATRHSRKLLSHAGIPAGNRLLAVHDQNEAASVKRVLGLLDAGRHVAVVTDAGTPGRSEEHTSELQSRSDLVCRLLLEK